MALSKLREPRPRSHHVAVGVGSKMLVWGGMDWRGLFDTTTVEVFDVLSLTWKDPRKLRIETLPDGFHKMAVAFNETKAYMFGGKDIQDTRFNDLYEVDLPSLECKKLVPAAGSAPPPSPRSSSSMVCVGRRLVVYGGFTGNEGSDELHVFDLDTNTWAAPATTGDKPPQLERHTLTVIDQHSALLFGGSEGRGDCNDTYVLDVESWQWRKVSISEKKPIGRVYHAASVIVVPDHDPLLLVIGGWGHIICSDVWLLDVTSGVWSQMHLPAKIIGRHGHSAVVFGTGPDFRVVILFGGSISNLINDVISKTTLLLLSQKGGSWVVDRVVGPGTQDNELRQWLKKLQIYSPLSDERAKQIIDKALESSSVKMRNVVAVLTGLMGSGKTWFLSRLFNLIPPSVYISTGIAEKSFRGLLHHLGSMSAQSWELFYPRHVLEYLAHVFREELPPADIARLAARIAAINTPAGTNPPSLPISTSSSITSPAPASPKPPTPATKSNTSQSMVRLVKAPQSSGSVEVLELLHMIDTGGQPEFMENMPSFVNNFHLAVLVLNLMFGLDEYPTIHYHDKGKAYKRALPSQHTNRQIIQKLASTVQAQRFSCKKGQCFRLLAIATHRDCVPDSELPARIEAFHQALKAILLPACDEELIPFSENEIPFILNLRDPDRDDLEKLALIREKVSESGVGEQVEMPGSFLIFEQELVEFAKQEAHRDILSLEECVQVGGKLKMKAEVVEAALIYFHRQITLLYFRHVLPNVVFTKPQLPLDVINSVVQFSYKVASGELKGVKPKIAKSLRDGIITEEILSHDLLLKCFIPNLYEPLHAIDLMCHTFTLAPLSREPQSKTGSGPAVQPNPSTPIKREKREYLMMSLRPAIPDKDIPQYIPAPSEIAPLVVKFSKDCVPLSCFSNTISCLLSMYDWRLSRADNGSPECLKHNVVSLFKPQTPGQIVLVDMGHSFQIHINADRDTDSTDFPEICFQVKETVLTAIKQVFDSLHLAGIEISPASICPCSRGPHPHSASAFLFKKRWFLHCSIAERSVGAALEEHTMWLDTPVTEKEKPSLPKLLKLKVPQKVGAHYEPFVCMLLNDQDGAITEAMEHDCQGKCERIVRKSLSEWLRGRGKPVTWRVLIETLRDCELTALADLIQENTQ